MFRKRHIILVMALFVISILISGLASASSKYEAEIYGNTTIYFDPNRTDDIDIAGRVFCDGKADQGEISRVKIVTSYKAYEGIISSTGYFTVTIPAEDLKKSSYFLNTDLTLHLLDDNNHIVFDMIAGKIVFLNTIDQAPSFGDIGDRITIQGTLTDIEGKTYSGVYTRIVHESGSYMGSKRYASKGVYKHTNTINLPGKYYLEVTYRNRNIYESYIVFEVKPNELSVTVDYDSFAIGREASQLLVQVNDSPEIKNMPIRYIITGGKLLCSDSMLSELKRIGLNQYASIGEGDNTFSTIVIDTTSRSVNLAHITPLAGEKLDIRVVADKNIRVSEPLDTVHLYEHNSSVSILPPDKLLQVEISQNSIYANRLTYIQPKIRFFDDIQQRFVIPKNVKVTIIGPGMYNEFLLHGGFTLRPDSGGVCSIQFDVRDEYGVVRDTVTKEIQIVGGDSSTHPIADEFTLEISGLESQVCGDNGVLRLQVYSPIPIKYVYLNNRLLNCGEGQTISLQVDVPLELGDNYFYAKAVDVKYNEASNTTCITRVLPSKLTCLVGSRKAQTENGTTVLLPAISFMDQESVLVPLKTFVSYFDGKVGYDSGTRTVSVSHEGVVSSVTLNESEAIVAGKTVGLSTPSRLVNGRTYVPVDLLAQMCNCRLVIDGSMFVLEQIHR